MTFLFTDPAGDISISREKTTETISLSPLWDSSVREEVTMTKMADFQIHKLKEENLVSGKSHRQWVQHSPFKWYAF